jgi:hypothetical protein
MEREYVTGTVVETSFDPAWPGAGYKFVIEYEDHGAKGYTNRYSSRPIYHNGDRVQVGFRIKGQPGLHERNLSAENVKAWLDRVVNQSEEPPLYFTLEANGRRYTYMRD